ncbi:hypothetical protein ECPA9_0143, partial [Escherichia coli PA9]
MRAPVKWRG